jgi:hypothetical protein
MERSIAWFVIAGCIAGCSGSSAGVSDGNGGGGGSGSGSGSAGNALFESPSSTSATPDSIFGLWGGVLPEQGWTFDTRVKLDESTFTFATRCKSPDGKQGGVASVTAKARVSNDLIDVLESKHDEQKIGDVDCKADTLPGESKRCAVEDRGFEHDCFSLDGTKLTMFGHTPFDKLEMTKISD